MNTENYLFPYPGKFTFVDVEIPNINNNCICAISLIVIEDHEIILRHTELINPKSFFSSQNVKIHGIQKNDVYGARTFKQFWKEFSRYFEKEYIIAAHNSMSDISVINKDLGRIHEKMNAEFYIDTMDLMSDFYFKGVWKKGDLKLDSIARRFGIYLEHHNPESDVNACYEVVRYLINIHDLDLTPFIKPIPVRKPLPVKENSKPNTAELKEYIALIRQMIADKDPRTLVSKSTAAGKGDKANRHHDFKKAVFYYEIAIAKKFSSPGVYMSLSALYEDLKLYYESLRILEIGMQNLKRINSGYYVLAREYNKKKRLISSRSGPALDVLQAARKKKEAALIPDNQKLPSNKNPQINPGDIPEKPAELKANSGYKTNKTGFSGKKKTENTKKNRTNNRQNHSADESSAKETAENKSRLYPERPAGDENSGTSDYLKTESDPSDNIQSRNSKLQLSKKPDETVSGSDRNVCNKPAQKLNVQKQNTQKNGKRRKRKKH